MPSATGAPEINRRYVCIADREATVLTAVISSYIFVPGSYTPVFLFPKVLAPKAVGDPEFMSEGYAANLMASPAAILINNALARIWPCEYLILAGLSEAQKTFLILPEESRIIDIPDIASVPSRLSGISPESGGEIRCRADDVLQALFIAQRRRKRIIVDESVHQLPEVVTLQKGIVVIEKSDDAAPVLAVNYAGSIGASVLVVDSVTRSEAREVQTCIYDWKQNGEPSGFERLAKAVEARLGGISFAQFEYATFFTEGLPYSLVLENAVPCSHVHLSLKPDLFILNCIIYTEGSHFHAAVVFSPIFFADEETTSLCTLFVRKQFCLRALIGADATLANLDFDAQHFPYDVLHLCSHGGEVEGYEMSESFVDQDGNQHVIEFDEVVGFGPAPDDPGMVSVHRKVFPRKLDGLKWMSPELEACEMPHHVYLDAWKRALESKGRRKRKGRIEMSCAIACVDSIHQGEFYALASHSSPIIFNNTCWSSHEVASFFLACGSRAYIGTLWAIENDAAVVAAEVFYENLFHGPILAAFHKAVKAIDKTNSKDIYVYWGLHFTTLRAARSAEDSRDRVRREFMRMASGWANKVESAESDEIKRNSLRVLKQILEKLAAEFDSPDVRTLDATIRGRLPDLFSRRGIEGGEQASMAVRRAFFERPVEYRKADKSE
jgi:hypothetical protein